ncbi:unnamed protein product, partial [Brassica oleracea]
FRPYVNKVFLETAPSLRKLGKPIFNYKNVRSQIRYEEKIQEDKEE